MNKNILIDSLIVIDDSGMPKPPTTRQLIDRDVRELYSRDKTKDKKQYIAECIIIYYLGDPKSPARQSGLSDPEALNMAIDQAGLNKDYIPDALVLRLIKRYYEENITEAGKKLIELYKAAGGILPGEVNYPTSWIKKQIDGNYQKSFTYAHAKTVYTDYANKKTLADKLSEVNTEIGNKANKTEIPTELPANGGNSATVNGHTVNADVPENAVFTDTVYDDTEVKEEIAEINSDLGGLSFSVSGTTLSITDGTNTWTLSQ